MNNAKGGTQLKIIESSQAKINLSLAIRGRFDDGYHDLNMIMQTISLADILEIKKCSEGIFLNLGSDINLPDNQDNIIWEAANKLIENFPDKIEGLEIKLKKNIPIAAGLAGGSSNAAAVIRGVNRLFQLNLNWSEMRKIGAEIGSDVPFCVKGGTAQVKGKGDQIRDLKPLKNYKAVLINPGFKVSTAKIFDEFAYGNYNKLNIPIAKLVELIELDRKIDWKEGWANQLEPVTFNLYPELKEIKKWLLDNGAVHSQLSGSGPTMIGFLRKKEDAEKIARLWTGKGKSFAVDFTKGY